MTVAVDEIRMRLRRKLEELVGVSEAEILLDRPPGGWADLVTNQILDLKLETLEHKLIGTMEREFRGQTRWLVTTLIAGMGAMTGALVAIAKF